MGREWTVRDIIEYADDANFNIEEKEAVLKYAIEFRELGDFLATTNGRVVLDSVVSQIRNLTMQIVALATDGAAKNVQDIIQAALLIKVSMNFMRSIATVASTGEKLMNQVKAEK